MTGFTQRRIARLLSLAVASVWIVTLVWAVTAVTPPLHCQRSHMPCCPSGESCSNAPCTEQIPEKTEKQAVHAKERDSARTTKAGVPLPVLRRGSAALVRELSAGLRFCCPVFRLKDDLRI